MGDMKKLSLFIIMIVFFSIPLVTPKTPAVADSEPPEFGDWIINENTTVTGETIVVHGDVIVKNGSALTLDYCTLKINSPLGRNGIEVEKGGELYVYNTTITSNNDLQYYYFDVSGKLQMEGTDVSRMGSPTTWGLLLEKTDDAVINNCRIHDSAPYCNGVTTRDSKVMIKDTAVYNTYIGIHCWGTSNVTLLGNHVWSNNIGIGITENAVAMVDGNDISNNINRGIGTDQNSKVWITNNTVKSNGRMGVWCFGDSAVDIINNIISNQDRGIQYSDTSHGKVTNNIIGSNNVNGIECGDNATSEIFDNNIISSNGYGGIVCFQNALVNISSNTISNNEKRGIELNDHSTVNIVGNSINMNKDIGIVCSENSDTKIINNIVANNNNYGMFTQLLKGGKLTAENNYLHGNGEAGIVVDFPSTVNLCNNTISAHAKDGIRVINGATPRIYNCTITNSGKYDIFVSGFSCPTIINTNFDLNKLFFNDTKSIISVGHWVDVNVRNKNRVPVQNAKIIVKNKDEVEVFNGSTDYNGHVSCIPVIEYDLDYTFNKTAYTPHNVYASKLGKSASEKITVDRHKMVNFTLDISDKLARGNLVTKIIEGHEVSVEYSGNGTVTIEPAKLVPEIPEPVNDISIFFDLKTEGEVEDLYITVKYNDEDLEGVNEANLRMYCYLSPGEFNPDEHSPGEFSPGEFSPGEFKGGWVMIKNSGVDVHSNTVWAKVNHTTVFAPMAKETSKQTDSGTTMVWLWYTSIVAVLIMLLVIAPVMRKKKRRINL